MVFFFLLFFGDDLWAQAALDLVYESEVSASSSSEATRVAFDEAVEKNSEKYSRELIGDAKFEKNIGVLKSKVFSQSGKYIPFIKAEKVSPSSKGFLVSVKLKLSTESLKQMLLDQGLLYRMEGQPRVLPMIGIVDRVNSQSYSWWLGSDSRDLSEKMSLLEKQLKADLREKGFFMPSPGSHGFQKSIPEVFQLENPRVEDLLFLGAFFDASIIARGSLIFRTHKDRAETFKIEVKIEALHSGNGRVIGEVIRSYDTETGPQAQVLTKKLAEVVPKVSEDLAIQLHEAWKRGTFGASLLRLVVSGRMSYPEMNEFKKELLKEAKDIKSLKERLFQSRSVTYEIDAALGPQQLAEVLGSARFSKFKVQVSDVGTDGLELSVKPL